MGHCDGHHHTKLCHLMGALLCLLFHVHIHSCYQGDLDNWPANNSQPSPGPYHGNITNTGDDMAINNNNDKTTVAESSLHLVLKDMFLKYGDGKQMTFEAFEHMLENIGLADLHIHDHNLNKHLSDDGFEDFHNNHNHSHEEMPGNHTEQTVKEVVKEGEKKSVTENMITNSTTTSIAGTIAESSEKSDNQKDRNKRRKKQRKDRGERTRREGQKFLDLHKCLSTTELLGGFGFEENSVIDDDVFVLLCPALIYQLDNHACRGSHKSCSHTGESHDHEHTEEEVHVTREKAQWNSSWTVWGYSFLSVLIISLVGLLSVAVIPLTKKVFYNHLLQFLVALAVGSLTGDACLHLLPHAISPHTHTDSSQDGHQPHNKESFVESKDAVWKGLAALSGIYFFFLMERVMGMITERKRKRNKIKRDKSPQAYKQVQNKETEIGAKLSSHATKVMSCEEMLMVVHPGKDLRHLAEDVHDEVHEHCDLGESESDHVQGHGHGHSHGPLPSSVSSVAWMVIMGDGLHNFSDGLAIGAAFANSLSGGVSTSVAVFCHELPHELGDFAVLLRAGMPAKQAIVYNLLSSVLCVLGMVVGVCVGNLSSASLWIFALIGGMFIYVALVDMLPEMTAVDPKAGEHPLLHLLLQNLGMLTGTGIMLVIALYEDKIQIPNWEV